MRTDLGHEVGDDAARRERVRIARRELLRMALERAESYGAIVRFMDGPLVSPGRASAVLMILFTDRYYRSCAARVGLARWGPRRGWASLLLRSVPSAFSRRWGLRAFQRVCVDFRRAAEEAREQAGAEAVASR